MGWSFNTQPQSRESFINQVCSRSFYHCELDVVRTSVVGSTVFAVLEWNAGDEKGKRMLCPTVISFDRRSGCYGYKGLGEEDICFRDLCPKHLIRLVEENPFFNDEKAVANREAAKSRVAAYNKKRNAIESLTEGTRVQLQDIEYELDAFLGPRIGWRVKRCHDDAMFRMTKKQLFQSSILTQDNTVGDMA